MKGRIEFYQPALRPDRDRPTLAFALRGAGVMVLLWLLACAYAGVNSVWQAEQNRQLRAAADSGQADIARLQQSLALLNQSRDDGRQQRLEQDIRARQRLLGVLSQEELVSYAGTLTELASIPWRDVALQGLTLDGQRMVIRGQASQRAAVPAWIQGFGPGGGLRGRTFSELSIQQQQPGLWLFTLQSEGLTP
ncbi:fimbrial assembly protein [Zobellella endophytica]|uniref:Fimbrial assembly protein n=1 Tax=Zobellella endophytica TaxID=2116700 RepID=A0A2P7RBZ8_9GAMM|nr:fimbrial assembly protein [Zobellella endophytica]PSJ47757.1 fimbrial assembly protein [Zobellella endophytica]